MTVVLKSLDRIYTILDDFVQFHHPFFFGDLIKCDLSKQSMELGLKVTGGLKEFASLDNRIKKSRLVPLLQKSSRLTCGFV
jgi:hypothetical protein